jgi:hypothetical protein
MLFLTTGIWLGGARLFHRPGNSNNEAEHEATDSAVNSPDCGRGNHDFLSTSIGHGTGNRANRCSADGAPEAAYDRVSDMVDYMNPRPRRVIPDSERLFKRVGIYADTFGLGPGVRDRPRISRRWSAAQLLWGQGWWKDDRTNGEQQEGDVHATCSFPTKRATIRTLT